MQLLPEQVGSCQLPIDSSKLWFAGWVAYQRWKLANLMESVPSRVFFISLVCINGITIGIQADHSDWDGWDPLEYVFVGLFTVEIALKLISFGFLFWTEWYHASLSTSIARSPSLSPSLSPSRHPLMLSSDTVDSAQRWCRCIYYTVHLIIL